MGLGRLTRWVCFSTAGASMLVMPTLGLAKPDRWMIEPRCVVGHSGQPYRFWPRITCPRFDELTRVISTIEELARAAADTEKPAEAIRFRGALLALVDLVDLRPIPGSQLAFWVGHAGVYLEPSNRNRFEPWLRAALVGSSDPPFAYRAWLDLAILAAHAGRWSEQERDLDRADQEAASPDAQAEVLTHRAMSFLRQGRADDASSCLLRARAVAVDPRLTELILWHLARALDLSEDGDRALGVIASGGSLLDPDQMEYLVVDSPEIDLVDVCVVNHVKGLGWLWQAITQRGPEQGVSRRRAVDAFQSLLTCLDPATVRRARAHLQDLATRHQSPRR